MIAQGREYVIDSVVASLTFTALLQDELENILQGQEATMDNMAGQLEAVSIRAAAVKHRDGLAHLKEQLRSVPTFRMRSSSSALAPAGEDPLAPRMFFELPETELPGHIRATHRALQPGGAPTAPVGDVLALGAQREGICYDLSSLDHVGWCVTSEEDRQQDAAARQARQVRRPTIQAAGVLATRLRLLLVAPSRLLLAMLYSTAARFFSLAVPLVLSFRARGLARPHGCRLVSSLTIHARNLSPRH